MGGIKGSWNKLIFGLRGKPKEEEKEKSRVQLKSDSESLRTSQYNSDEKGKEEGKEEKVSKGQPAEA